MVDGISIMTIAAAAIVGWLLCVANKRVFWGWKLIAPGAVIYLSGYLFFALIGPGSSMVLWSGIEMDRVTLALSLLPVFVWPMEFRSLRLFRNGGDGGVSAI